MFIGSHDALGEAASLATKLDFLAASAPMTTFDALSSSLPNKFLTGDRPLVHPIWNVMIRVLLARESTLPASSDDIRSYQRFRLCGPNEAAALLELMPLPDDASLPWPYGRYFPQYATRDDYLRDVLPRRRQTLRAHLAYGPRLIVAYGESAWGEYKALFAPEASWTSRASFEVADLGATRVILAPHLTTRKLNACRAELVTLACEREASERIGPRSVVPARALD
ncbi:MAG: hypothetical protein NVS4B5_14460 [Vulcanimicrobiaceae bacterium]